MQKSELRKRRELEILRVIEKGQIMTAAQLRKLNVGRLGESSYRNTLRVLREMENDGHLMSKHVGMKLFSVNDGGRFGFWEHVLVRNDFLIWKGWFHSAFVERPLIVDDVEICRPDAIVVVNGEPLCIEVDRRQKKRTNIQKMEKYLEHNVKVGVVGYRTRLKEWPGNVAKYPIEDFR